MKFDLIINKKTTLNFCMANMIFKGMIEKSGTRRKTMSPILHHLPSITTSYPKRKMMTRHFQWHNEGWCLVTGRHYRTSQLLFVFYSYFIFIKISNCPLANLTITKKNKYENTKKNFGCYFINFAFNSILIVSLQI